ncbi:2-hydroxy-3-oxopropionate reductase [Veronia nyctiphanis]|uniref:2-hydroxy-3-oxopropionate reductase n=1 Tax=Veronia nyctiphanis TaxID=1278244 RepID=A0A4Q0YTJ1_9GAMM|nr:NAD(P)-dependent oxidoreductase [Veronia nyctiphanis]RXJ74033.1 2-hydroxy-3-oxopropionate reductase [Veronia nyctiphanis]
MAQGKTLGFIGLGLMGNPMTARLLKAGFSVNVWVRDSKKAKTATEAGAKLCVTIDELVQHSDILMLCVSDTAAVESVIEGPQGVLEAIKNNDKASLSLIIDFSSISPQATTRLARSTGDCGVKWIDSPVSGGVAGAESGSLAVMCGGDKSEIESLSPIYAVLAKNVTHVGDVGSGQVTKIANQMLVSCNVMVMAEVFALAEKAGVDATQIPLALKGGFADSLPLQLTGPRMAEQDFEEVKWHVKTLLKDLDMANDLAFREGSSVPMTGLAAELMRLHANKGYLDADPSTLVLQYATSLDK